jgi:hypothetical protein
MTELKNKLTAHGVIRNKKLYADDGSIVDITKDVVGEGFHLDSAMYDQSQIWFKKGKIHREEGPAIILHDGSCFWFKNGLEHREGAPAIELKSYRSNRWCKNGKTHREDGPAEESWTDSNGWDVTEPICAWYINDEKCSEELFITLTKSTKNEIEKLINVDIKRFLAPGHYEYLLERYNRIKPEKKNRYEILRESVKNV